MATTKELFKERMKIRKTDPVRASVLGMLIDTVQKNIRELNREETEADLDSLLQTKESEYYNEVMAGWKAEYPLTIEESVWADVKFNNSYELVVAE